MTRLQKIYNGLFLLQPLHFWCPLKQNDLANGTQVDIHGIISCPRSREEIIKDRFVIVPAKLDLTTNCSCGECLSVYTEDWRHPYLKSPPCEIKWWVEGRG